MTKVTVIIPVKDRNSELKRAINSVINQTVQDIEVLVIDDKSSLDIQSIIIAYKDNRLKYILNTKEVSNANVCRNIGLDFASGKYIAMLDSDDEWMSNHLESKINFLEKNGVDGVFGSYIIDNGVKKISVISRPFKENEKMINYLLSDGRAATPTQVYKSEFAKQIRWDEELLRHQDYDFSVRFAERFLFIPCPEITCIVHWTTGERRREDLVSQINFIQKTKKDIDPLLYNRYHQKVYKLIYNRNDVKKSHKDYFKRESYHYINAISFNDFYFVHTLENSNSIKNKIKFRLLYTLMSLWRG